MSERCKGFICQNERPKSKRVHIWWQDYGTCSRACAEDYYGEEVLPGPHDVMTSADTLPRVGGKPNMVMRSLRVPAKLWEEAKAKADEREENISDVIREALERYVRRKS